MITTNVSTIGSTSYEIQISLPLPTHLFRSYLFFVHDKRRPCTVHTILNIILAHILIFTFAPFSMANKCMHLMEKLLVLSPFTTMICTVRDTPFVHGYCLPLLCLLLWTFFFCTLNIFHRFAWHFAFSLMFCPLTDVNKTMHISHTHTQTVFYICTRLHSLHVKWHFCAW